MTDRDRHAAPDPIGGPHPEPDPIRADGDSMTPTHQDSAPRGDAPAMPLTLPTRTHGRTATDHPSAPPAPTDRDRGRSWLSRLFNGDLALSDVGSTPVAHHGRSPAEHAAIARALGCPDLFVVDVADRSVRERLITDLARLAAACGEHVLALSPDPTTADRIAEALASDTAVVRALAPDEHPHRLTPGAAQLTSAEQGPGRIERQRREAAETVAGLEVKLAALAPAADALARMRELVGRSAEADREHAALSARLAGLDAEVREEAGSRSVSTVFTERVGQVLATAEAGLKSLRENRAAVLAALKDKEAALTAARQHHTEAVSDGGKKHGFFVRLFTKSKPHGDPADLERQTQSLETEAKDLSDREAKLQAELDAATAALAAESDRLVAEETVARRTDLETRLAALSHERDRQAADFRDQIPFVFGAGFGVVSPDAESVNTVAATIAAAQTALDQQLADVKGRHDEFTRRGPDQARQLLAEAPIVVGTPGSTASDPVFDGRPPFGLLVLDRAEELTEAAFNRLSRLADRWVLVGDAGWPEDPRTYTNGSHPHRRPGHWNEPTLAAQIARLVDREPWAIEGARLVIRLAHLEPAQRRHMWREPLIDQPHIELRFITGSDGDPMLAEIAFPAATLLAEAKALVFTQLGAVLLRPCGECVWHRDEKLSVCWPAAEAATHAETWVNLEAGVCEKLVGTGPGAFTAAVTFDPSAGWDADKAEAWLAEHLPPSPGRLAVLPRLAAHRPAVVG